MEIYPTLEKIVSTPELSAIPIGSTTLGAILPQQIHIGVEGTWPMSSRRLVPQTPAAEQALAGVSGQRLATMLHGILGELDGHEQTSILTGFSLASSTTGFAANMLANDVTIGAKLVTSLAPDWSKSTMGHPVDLAHITPKSVAELANAARVINDRFAPQFSGQTMGTMVLGPQVSGYLLRLAANPADTSDLADPVYGNWNTHDLVHDVLHEAQHAISPPRLVKTYPIEIEEGTADVLSTWPGAIEAAATRMGIVLTAEAGHEDGRFYAPWASALRSMLIYAGIEPSDPAQRGAASALLQTTDANRVPTRLTHAIMQYNHIPNTATTRSAIRAAIIGGDIDALDKAMAAALPPPAAQA